MKSLIKISLFLIFLFPILGDAQNSDFSSFIGKDLEPIEKEFEIIPPIEIEKLSGSPYFSDEYMVAFIKYQDSFYTFPLVKYNILNNWLEINHKGGMRKFDLAETESFSFINPTSDQLESFYNTENLKFKEHKVNGFARKIKKGDYNIFISQIKFIRKPTENDNAFGEGLNPRIVHKNAVYLEDENWLYVLRKKKDILTNLKKGHKNKASTFISKNKLKFKKIADYILLFDYLKDLEDEA